MRRFRDVRVAWRVGLVGQQREQDRESGTVVALESRRSAEVTASIEGAAGEDGSVWRIVRYVTVGLVGVVVVLFLYWLVWVIGALLGLWGEVGY
jgi:hypothetical protein